MTEELSFEAYLGLFQNKFEIYLLDKKNLKNIYKEEVYLENGLDLIDYNLLHSFLDKNNGKNSLRLLSLLIKLEKSFSVLLDK